MLVSNQRPLPCEGGGHQERLLRIQCMAPLILKPRRELTAILTAMLLGKDRMPLVAGLSSNT